MRFALVILLLASGPAIAADRGVASTFNDRVVACPPYRFNPDLLGAAHRTLPCGARVRVTNEHNGRSVVVTIIDLGPCASEACKRSQPRAHSRLIDLYPRAAQAIGSTGLARVSIENLDQPKGGPL